MIGMALCMLFITILVVKMIFSAEDGLVDKNYYEKGQLYNAEYNAKERAVKDEVVPKIEATQNGLTIIFSKPSTYKLVCKRPSNQRMDKTVQGFTDDNLTLYVPKVDLQKGPWLLQLEYSIAGINYLVKREILMP